MRTQLVDNLFGDLLQLVCRLVTTCAFLRVYVALTNTCVKPVFHWANLFARREAKTRIRQRDWLTKQRTFSPTNHVAEFLFSLRVARTNSPSGKRASDSRPDQACVRFGQDDCTMYTHCLRCMAWIALTNKMAETCVSSRSARVSMSKIL